MKKIGEGNRTHVISFYKKYGSTTELRLFQRICGGWISSFKKTEFEKRASQQFKSQHQTPHAIYNDIPLINYEKYQIFCDFQ